MHKIHVFCGDFLVFSACTENIGLTVSYLNLLTLLKLISTDEQFTSSQHWCDIQYCHSRSTWDEIFWWDSSPKKSYFVEPLIPRKSWKFRLGQVNLSFWSPWFFLEKSMKLASYRPDQFRNFYKIPIKTSVLLANIKPFRVVIKHYAYKFNYAYCLIII